MPDNSAPKVLVISHSYCVPENRKNITELQRFVEVQVALPDRIYDPVQGWLTTEAKRSEGYLVFRRLTLPRSQYLLATWDFGMRRFAPDIIHVEYDPWSIIFWQVFLCRWLFARQAKLVCTVKKNTYRQLPWLLEVSKNAVAKFFINKVSHFIAVSDGVKDIYADRFNVPSARITIMQHLGLDLSVFAPRRRPWQPLTPGKFTIGYCGRLDANKGIEDLLLAVEELSANGGHTIAVKLLGNGKLREALGKRNLPWLELLEPVPHDEVAAYLHEIDIFVLASHITPDHQEHDAHALLEALACGIPSIGSTSGIIPEVLGNGVGLVFEAANSAQLKAQLEQLIMDEELRKSISQRAIEIVHNRFSITGISKQKSEIYERIQA